MQTIHPISVEQWADKNKVDRRTAQRWAQEEKLPLIPRPVVLRGVDPSVTLDDLVKAKKIRRRK
jgi:predicted site-specific integrase-resolvase